MPITGIKNKQTNMFDIIPIQPAVLPKCSLFNIITELIRKDNPPKKVFTIQFVPLNIAIKLSPDAKYRFFKISDVAPAYDLLSDINSAIGLAGIIRITAKIPNTKAVRAHDLLISFRDANKAMKMSIPIILPKTKSKSSEIKPPIRLSCSS